MKSKRNYLYIMFLLFVIVVLSTGISFSRYVTTLSNTGDMSTIITVNEYNLTAHWNVHPNGVQFPGMNEQSYDFTLENTKTTDLYYDIEIAMSWNQATPVAGLSVPLDVELYVINPDNSLTQVSTTSVSGTTIDNIYTQESVISGNQTIDFRMIWNWGTTPADRDYRFSGKKIDIAIDVNGRQ